MSRSFTFLFVSVFTFLLKIFGFIPRFLFRSRASRDIKENGSNFKADLYQEDDRSVTDNCTSKVILSTGVGEKESLELQRSDDDGSNGATTEVEDSVFLQSKYEFMSGRDVIQYAEEPKVLKFMAQEMFVGSNKDLNCCDQNLDPETSLEHELANSLQESSLPSFSFQPFDPSCFRVEDTKVDMGSVPSDQGQMPHISSTVAWNWDSFGLIEKDHCGLEQKEDNSLDSFCTELDERNENFSSSYSEVIEFEGEDSSEDEMLEDQDFSYELELLSPSRYLEPDVKQDTLINDQEFVEGIDFIETNDKSEPEYVIQDSNIDDVCLAIRSSILGAEKIEDLDDDDEYIELEPSKVRLTGVGTDNSRNHTKNEEGVGGAVNASGDGLQEKEKSWDSDSDDVDESADALREHQNLIQQMKMELKHCRINGLPTISEECETQKIIEDLKPLYINHKFDYKDLMAEIHKFYNCYVEKMRKLDILNYQTLHAISFLQLKESEVFTTGKKKTASIHFNMSKIWSYKVQKIYAHPMQKSIKEMQHDLELVYVGQLCLSWEILCWLYIKGQELMEYDSNGHHSYNRVAEEFQQFQVLVQRFTEDERFQGPRVQNYVKNRCMIRSLLQVPIIKDDCLKDKKDREEEKDAISLALLVEIIRESMLIFREFLHADKAAANVMLKGVQGTKVVSEDTTNSELLVEVIASLQKKDRRVKEHTRSQNCIVKKFQKNQEWRLDHELFASQVELRLVSRVLSLSRLTTDHLVWCQNKLGNISFVRRRVHLESSFLLFPC